MRTRALVLLAISLPFVPGCGNSDDSSPPQVELGLRGAALVQAGEGANSDTIRAIIEPTSVVELVVRARDEQSGIDRIKLRGNLDVICDRSPTPYAPSERVEARGAGHGSKTAGLTYRIDFSEQLSHCPKAPVAMVLRVSAEARTGQEGPASHGLTPHALISTDRTIAVRGK